MIFIDLSIGISKCLSNFKDIILEVKLPKIEITHMANGENYFVHICPSKHDYLHLKVFFNTNLIEYWINNPLMLLTCSNYD